jgi:protein CpxP
MKTLRKNILIALTVLGVAGASLAVHAQQAPAPEGRQAHAMSMEKMHEKMGEHMAKRQAKLHDALKLTAAQEPAWAAFQAAIKPPAMGTRPDHATWATLSAPARMEKMIEMAKQHTTTMEAHLAALNTFYAVLTPEQKKVFDDMSMGGAHGGHPMAHMQRMGH